MTDFFKYQALGNDYVVIDPRCTDVPVSPESVRLVCDRHFGIGADGVLYGPLEEPPPRGPGPAGPLQLRRLGLRAQRQRAADVRPAPGRAGAGDVGGR